MSKNPWKVKSIEAFVCLKCPECEFNSKEENVFQDHAVLNHPMSAVLFGKFEQNLQRFEEDHLSLEEDHDMTAKDPLTVDLNLKNTLEKPVETLIDTEVHDYFESYEDATDQSSLNKSNAQMFVIFLNR